MDRDLATGEFLLFCSEVTLCDFELARRNFAANKRKQIKAMEQQIKAIEEDVAELEFEAQLAHWLRAHRGELLRLTSIDLLQKRFDFANGPGPKTATLALESGKSRLRDAG